MCPDGRLMAYRQAAFRPSVAKKCIEPHRR
jgi:hypothetical protein